MRELPHLLEWGTSGDLHFGHFGSRIQSLQGGISISAFTQIIIRVSGEESGWGLEPRTLGNPKLVISKGLTTIDA